MKKLLGTGKCTKDMKGNLAYFKRFATVNHCLDWTEACFFFSLNFKYLKQIITEGIKKKW